MTAAEPPELRLLGDRLEHWARVRPDDPALAFGDRRWSWARWRDRVHRATGALLAAGVRWGDRIAVLDKNHPACLDVTYAAAAIGATTAIVNWRLAADELDYVIRDSGARILVVGHEFESAVRAIRDRLPEVRQVVVVGGPADEYESWLAAAEPAPPADEVRPDDVCLLLYSSGTTGRPKGVLLTHRNLAAHTVRAGADFAFGPGDRNLVAMPLFHVGGTSYAQFGVAAGVPTILTRDPDLGSLTAAVADGATHAFLVPAVVAGILAAGPDAAAPFRALKVLGYGAAPMPAPVLRAALAAWPDTGFLQVYGMTELAGVISRLLPAEHRQSAHPERLTSAGTLLPGAEVRVVDVVTREDLPPGETGELWFRSVQVMAGYHRSPEATAEVLLPGGWLRSGDIGRVDADGFIHLADRLKDMIITGGENVYSPEVERVLAEYPGVADVAVIGVPDDRWGESVKAIVTLEPGARPLPGELIAFCRDRLAHYKCPRTVDIVPELPRNPGGKVLKKVLREPHWEGHERRI